MRIFILLASLMALAPLSLWGCSPAPEHPRLALAERLGCYVCHALNGKGGTLAAPLDDVGARLSPRQLQLALTHPRQLHPNAKMPSYAYLPQAEHKTLLTYLESLK